MLRLGAQVTGLEKVRAEMARLGGPQLRGAMAKALTDTGFQVRRQMQQQMAQKFDRPTPFITRAPKVFPATPDNLAVTVAPTYRSELGTVGGKIGVDPQQVLQAQELGGQRRDKRSEVALARVGILPRGMQLAIPATPFPGSADAYGNLRGPFLVQLISYFQAFGEQGYRANMTDRTRGNLARGGTASRLAKVAGPTLGRRYFVSYGKARGGARVTRKGEPDQRASNLPAGIWAVLGASGAVVKPVVMFVLRGTYKPRLDFKSLGESQATQEYLAQRMRKHIRDAAGV
ncbi:hypothetical protein [Acidovorax sp. Leaf160]|uniref:hypothetical protein n=1 Tax=Acidovorax sp. Leaf160 TaxID=1736280 RepID=UPI0006FE512E|nr:hypothetical protein [Acidovorax sp. Leaf160]KQR55641.1 hypothetical protein ASF94_04370 [Acidovorax sp. Leaf160]